MMWLKACPRCRGDIYPEGDIFGTYLKCLQCGHVLTDAQRQRLELWARRPAASAVVEPASEQRAA